jgi:hypothetical protein
VGMDLRRDGVRARARASRSAARLASGPSRKGPASDTRHVRAGERPGFGDATRGVGVEAGTTGLGGDFIRILEGQPLNTRNRENHPTRKRNSL